MAAILTALALAAVSIAFLVWLTPRALPPRKEPDGLCARCGDEADEGEQLCEECLWHWAIK